MKFNIYNTYLRLTCQEATFLLSKQQETPLTTKERFKLRFHTAICKSCTLFAKQVALLDASLARFFAASSENKLQFSPEKKASLAKLIEKNSTRP
jgi:hypothetical protein